MAEQQLAHVVGAEDDILMEKTINAALDEAAAKWPDQEAVVSAHQGIRFTYSELKTKAEEVAAGLRALGVKKGDRVGIWSPNYIEWTLTMFASSKIGAILVNVNPAYRPSELEFVLVNVGISVLVTPESYKTSEYAKMVETLAPEIKSNSEGMPIKSANLPDLRHVVLIDKTPRPGWVSFNSLAENVSAEEISAVRAIEPTLDCNDPINIQFTSGTTGLPKGATLSHRNILNNGYYVGKCIGLTAGDRLCIPVPLYHCFGMVMGNLGCLNHGAAMIYPAPTFDPGATLQTLQDEKCTGLYGVPTMFIAQLAHPDFKSFDLSSMRTGCMAGSPCPVETMKQVVGDMNMGDVTIAYGMTETSPVSFQSTPDDPIERRVSTLGKVLPHLECKVVGENGETLPVDTPGELCTKGYSVMIGYWGDEEKTKSVIDEYGWMHTGDLATIDEEGYGNIVGRIKDMIIRGGENIYPREIEEFLFSHSAVNDVAILGVPDEKFGEEVCAWIQLKPGKTASADELKGFCKGKIAHYKVPRYIEIVEEFPMTVTGKIRKVEIRQIMAKKLGVEETETA